MDQVLTIKVGDMNIISLVFLGLMVISSLWGFFAGLARGLRRSILRLILVVICLLAAFLLREVITNILLSLDASAIGLSDAPMTIQEYIIAQLPEEFAGLGDTLVIPLVKIVVNIVTYVVLFWVLKLVTWIILYPICKIFVKKGEKKHAGFGGLVGLLQGAIVSLAFLTPLVGIMGQAPAILSIMDSINNMGATASVTADETTSSTGDETMDMILGLVSEHNESAIGKYYNAMCGKPFSWIASTKTEKGKIYLAGAIEGVDAGLKMVNTVADVTSSLENFDIQNPDSWKDLKGTMQQLDKLKGDMSDEAKDTLNTVLATVMDSLTAEDGIAASLPEEAKPVLDVLANAISEIDILSDDFSFESEYDVIETVATKVTAILDDDKSPTQEEITQTVSEVLDTMSESKLIVPIISSLDEETLGNFGLELDDDIKEGVTEMLEETVTQDNRAIVEAIIRMLGLDLDVDEVLDAAGQN